MRKELLKFLGQNPRVIGMLESSEDYFSDQHVGATWKLRHSIPSQCSKGLNKSGQLELELDADTQSMAEDAQRLEQWQQAAQAQGLQLVLAPGGRLRISGAGQ